MSDRAEVVSTLDSPVVAARAAVRTRASVRSTVTAGRAGYATVTARRAAGTRMSAGARSPRCTAGRATHLSARRASRASLWLTGSPALAAGLPGTAVACRFAASALSPGTGAAGRPRMPAASTGAPFTGTSCPTARGRASAASPASCRSAAAIAGRVGAAASADNQQRREQGSEYKSLCRSRHGVERYAINVPSRPRKRSAADVPSCIEFRTSPSDF